MMDFQLVLNGRFNNDGFSAGVEQVGLSVMDFLLLSNKNV